MSLLFGLDTTKENQPAPAQPAHLITTAAKKATDAIFASQPKATPAPFVMPAPSSIGPVTGNTSPTPNLSTVAGRLSAPPSSLPWYMQPGRAANDVITSSVDDFATRVSDAYHSLYPPADTQFVNYAHDTNVQKASKVMSAGLGALNVAFSPATALIKGAEQIPVVKVGAQLVDTVFQKVGNVGGVVGSEIIDRLPVSDETKKALKPPVTELFGLLSQIILGKAGHEVVGKMDSLHSNISDIVKSDPAVRNIEVKSQAPGENPIKVNTPTTKHADYAASQGYEGYIPPSELPVIDAGAKPKSALPVIQTEPAAPTKLGSFVYEDLPVSEITKIVDNSIDKRISGIRERSLNYFLDNPAEITSTPIRIREVDGHLTIEDGRHRLQAAKDLNISNLKVEDVTPRYTGQSSGILDTLKTRSIEGTGEKKVRGLSAGVDATAVENKLTSGFGDLPEYKVMDIKAQAQKALDLIKADYERAKRVALGQETSPQGLHPEAVFTAVEAHATKMGDVRTLRDLATRSHLTEAATSMGQRIKLLDERNPDSPVKAIRDVAKAREEAAKRSTKDVKKVIKDTAKDIKAEVDKAKPKKQDWQTFIRELQC